MSISLDKRHFKLVLLGASSVGKSCIALRFVKGQFIENNESTIGAAFFTQTVALKDNSQVKFEIWDTAGQERYHSLTPMYYRTAQAAIIAYDITNTESFIRAKSWVKELQRQIGQQGVVIALAGNKVDLAATRRKVSVEEGQAFADENELIFLETSAKTGVNVTELFQGIAEKLPQSNSLLTTESPGAKILVRDNPPPKGSCCSSPSGSNY